MSPRDKSICQHQLGELRHGSDGVPGYFRRSLCTDVTRLNSHQLNTASPKLKPAGNALPFVNPAKTYGSKDVIWEKCLKFLLYSEGETMP